MDSATEATPSGLNPNAKGPKKRKSDSKKQESKHAPDVPKMSDATTDATEAGPSGLDPNTKDSQKRKSDPKKQQSQRTLTEIAAEFVKRDGPKGKCIIDPSSDCTHEQDKFDSGNFIRHLRSKHPEKALEVGLMKDEDTATRRPRIVAKRPIAIDAQLFVDSGIKLVSLHNLPLASLEWEGLKQLFDPISDATGVILNRKNIKPYLRSAAEKIQNVIANEMKGKLISLKVDSASKHHRHILGINAQYVLRDKVVIRTLGKLFFKIFEILPLY